MGEQAMERAAKQRVKEVLVAHAQAELDASRQSVAEQDAAAVLDQDSSFSADDQSQSDQAGDLSAIMSESLARAEAAQVAVEGLDVSPRSDVGPGAFVSFGGYRYVVGIVSDEVMCDGLGYEGISLDSDIYAVIKGLRAGDTFEFRGKTHTVESVD